MTELSFNPIRRLTWHPQAISNNTNRSILKTSLVFALIFVFQISFLTFKYQYNDFSISRTGYSVMRNFLLHYVSKFQQFCRNYDSLVLVSTLIISDALNVSWSSACVLIPHSCQSDPANENVYASLCMSTQQNLTIVLTHSCGCR